MKTLSAASGDFFKRIDLRALRRETAQADKCCFEYALRQFLSSGRKEDAFTVYFCFSEIFDLFGSGYENTKKLLETLSDHEYHSGELLAKHRDHYSHSVYVFALGLALYAGDPAFRECYLSFYGLEEGEGAADFLKYWGMTALFHDVGYPFQLAHGQVKAYTEEVWGKNKSNLYVSYGNLGEFTAIGEEARAALSEDFPASSLSDCNDLLAYGLDLREGYDPHAVRDLLVERVVRQPAFMDHGYFSAVILAKGLLSVPKRRLNVRDLDVLTAILLHNSFNKFDAPARHPISMEEHPLAYLLILCDELQCWDRFAYGKISKRDPLAWEFALETGENTLDVRYTFDSYTVRGAEGEIPNRNYEALQRGDLASVLGTFILSPLRLTVHTREKKKPKKMNFTSSDDSFISLCDFAKAIHISYNEHCGALDADFIGRDFGALSLEFKLSNIEQAKSYAEKLESVHCFYSGKDLDYPVVEDLSRVETGFKDNFDYLCRAEHVRWVREKLAMGWRFGTDYTSREERDRKKIHKDIVPYDMLSREEREKDALMVRNVFRLLKKFDGNIRIYDGGAWHRPALDVAGTGHRSLANPRKLKPRIKRILEKLAGRYRLTVRTCFAAGADQLIAECAAELGIPLKADLPMPVGKYIAAIRRDARSRGGEFTGEDEMNMRHLLAQTVVCRTVGKGYEAASRYIVERCDMLIALWDGVELPLFDESGAPVNRGGTYDCIRLARELGKKTLILPAPRV